MSQEEIITEIARRVDESDELGLCPGYIYPTRYGYMMEYEGNYYCNERMPVSLDSLKEGEDGYVVTSSTDALIERLAEKVLAKDVFVEPEGDDE